MSRIVLITTASNPPEGMIFLRMTNVATRIIATKAAVFFWAAQGIEKIVIADATGSTLLNHDEISMLEKMSVEVEQIHYFQNEELIKRKGKGYGEGELIRYALNNSHMLNQEESFYKCTGKIYCRNFTEISQIIKQNNISIIFWKLLDGGDLEQMADTRFYYTTKNFAEKYLIPAYLAVDDNNNKAYAEHNVYKLLKENLSYTKGIRPLLSGFSGTSAKQIFDLSLGALDINFPCWIKSRMTTRGYLY